MTSIVCIFLQFSTFLGLNFVSAYNKHLSILSYNIHQDCIFQITKHRKTFMNGVAFGFWEDHFGFAPMPYKRTASEIIRNEIPKYMARSIGQTNTLLCFISDLSYKQKRLRICETHKIQTLTQGEYIKQTAVAECTLTIW